MNDLSSLQDFHQDPEQFSPLHESIAVVKDCYVYSEFRQNELF